MRIVLMVEQILFPIRHVLPADDLSKLRETIFIKEKKKSFKSTNYLLNVFFFQLINPFAISCSLHLNQELEEKRKI